MIELRQQLWQLSVGSSRLLSDYNELTFVVMADIVGVLKAEFPAGVAAVGICSLTGETFLDTNMEHSHSCC